MKKYFLPVIVAGLTLTACKKTEEVKTDDASVLAVDSVENKIPTDTVTTIPTGDTTATSVDWNGTYTGTLPCASCPGIETTLTINSDRTYSLDENYLEEKDGSFSEKGKFNWSADGSFITLAPETAHKDDIKKVYFVAEGFVYQVSNEGDRSMKEQFKLTKQ